MTQWFVVFALSCAVGNGGCDQFVDHSLASVFPHGFPTKQACETEAPKLLDVERVKPTVGSVAWGCIELHVAESPAP